MGYVGKIKDSSGTTHLVASTLFGTCSTAAGTAKKIVSCSNFNQLETGVTIHVRFKYSNTATDPTLNVNSTGEINIKRYGDTSPGTSSTTSWYANSVVSFTYDGTSWMMNDFKYDNNTQNTAGADQSTSTLFLVGTTSQATGRSYSNAGVYMTNGNLNLGGASQEGTLTLHTGDAQDASTGVLHQASTSWNINHYLPITSSVTEDSYLLNQENLIPYLHYLGTAAIYNSGTKIAIINNDHNLIENYEDVYFIIYFKDKDSQFNNTYIVRINDTDIVPPATAGSTGNVFSLVTTSVPSHLYIRTLVCHFVYTNGVQWELYQDYQTETRLDIPSTLDTATTYTQYQSRKNTSSVTKWVQVERIEIWARGNDKGIEN